MLVWGFFVSTVAATTRPTPSTRCAIASASARYDTNDDSRNNLWLALLTFGEGWHNNHHHYPASTRQGFYWWEIDLTYYGLRLLALLGIDLGPEASARARCAKRARANRVRMSR